MGSKKWILGLVAAGLILGIACGEGKGAVLGIYETFWWDDPVTNSVVVTPTIALKPSPDAELLLGLIMEHLDQAQTTDFYNSLPDPWYGVKAAVTDAEAFIYTVTNGSYGSGNGPPWTVGPFSFTTPPGNLGANGISGINIIDTHGALNVAMPVPNSQFIYTTRGILDFSPTSTPGAEEDWEFNAVSGPGNFEWTLSPALGNGIVGPGDRAVFGFAMPGHWQHAFNDGWVHSWQQDGPSPVNTAFAINGYLGPSVIPEPTTLAVWSLLGAIGISVGWWRRSVVERRLPPA